MSGKRSRDKGARGERRCCDFFKGLGLPAYRVSSLETDPNSPVDYDVQLGGGLPYKVQVKEVAKNCPPLPKLMENATVGYVHYTNGRTFVIVDADDLLEFAGMVAAAAAEEAQ